MYERFTLAASGQLLLGFLVILVLASCAGRPGPELLHQTALAAPGTKTVTVYVATTRERDAKDVRAFTSGRADKVSYAEYTISIPPNHKPGNIEWPMRRVDASKNFAVVSSRILDQESFEREVSKRRGGLLPDIGVFVHGYNTNFQEALYRMAQITTDANVVDAAPILFSWPSDGSLSGYLSDKDAVTYSRDQLAALLSTLAAKRTRGNITLVGHSMGGWLTAETVRQLRLSGRNDVISRLHVILAAPDIDIDVFRSQIAAIGSLEPPMTVLVSRDDLALRASEFLSVERQRVGQLDVNDRRVEDVTRSAGIQVIDISGLKANDSFRHTRFAALATMYSKLSGSDANRERLDLRQTGAFVFNTFGATISSPFVLAGKVVGGK